MDELPRSSSTGTGVAVFAGTAVKRDHKAITGWQVDEEQRRRKEEAGGSGDADEE